MEPKRRAVAMLDALYVVLSNNRYVAGMLVAMLLFGISNAVLPVLFIPGARLSPASILNSLSALDLALLGLVSVLFGLVTAMQVYELRRLARTSASGRVATLSGTIVGLLAAKSCCILPLILLMVGSLSAALLVSAHLTEIRAAGAGIMAMVFVVTAARVGRGVVPAGAETSPSCDCDEGARAAR